MNVKRPPHALLSLAALATLFMAGLALVHNTDAGVSNDVGDQLARVGIEGEGDIPLPGARS